MQNNYWNDTYWKKHLKDYNGENPEDISDLWLDKYSSIISIIPEGKVLDLGCGIGQYTRYLIEKGFDVTSADVSIEALNKLKNDVTNAKTMELDMSKPLPFGDNSFDLVFANLSIHYFDKETTIKLLKEIKRIVKDNGYFIGSVNSSKTYKYIKDIAKEIEPNYYFENGRSVRLWDKEQFDFFFKEYDLEALEEVTTIRWNKTKIMWEYVAKVRKYKG